MEHVLQTEQVTITIRETARNAAEDGTTTQTEYVQSSKLAMILSRH